MSRADLLNSVSQREPVYMNKKRLAPIWPFESAIFLLSEILCGINTVQNIKARLDKPLGAGTSQRGGNPCGPGLEFFRTGRRLEG